MIRRRNRFIRSALRGRTSLPVEIPAAAMRDVRISTSASLCVPVALRRREICIPASTFSGLGSVERESIILHEIAHVERNDPLWLDASRLVKAVTWWQPLNRIICEKLECETELAADQHAISLGAKPRALVAGLAHYSALLNGTYAGAGAALVRGDSPLVVRARVILDGPDASPKVSSRLVWAGIIGMTAAALMLPVPTTAQKGQDVRKPNTVVEERELILR
jgi:beta-lactamase regulating signal transducer with metallopeptidase domain